MAYLKLLGIGTAELLDFLTVLEEHECGHGAHSVQSGNFLERKIWMHQFQFKRL
jgi:hypothetical protein